MKKTQWFKVWLVPIVLFILGVSFYLASENAKGAWNGFEEFVYSIYCFGAMLIYLIIASIIWVYRYFKNKRKLNHSTP